MSKIKVKTKILLQNKMKDKVILFKTQEIYQGFLNKRKKFRRIKEFLGNRIKELHYFPFNLIIIRNSKNKMKKMIKRNRHNFLIKMNRIKKLIYLVLKMIKITKRSKMLIKKMTN